MSKIDIKKYRKALGFINKIIGISEKQKTAYLAAQLGLGGQKMIIDGMLEINKMCESWKKQKEAENEQTN